MLASSGALPWTDFQRNSVVAVASFLRHPGRKQSSGPHADVNLGYPVKVFWLVLLLILNFLTYGLGDTTSRHANFLHSLDLGSSINYLLIQIFSVLVQGVDACWLSVHID